MKLHKTILAAAALAVLTLYPGGQAFCAEKIAAVSVFVQGDVTFARSGSEAYAELKANELLHPGYLVKTGAGARASLITKTGAEIRINENSVLEMPGKSGLREMFGLAMGQVWSRMLHKRAKLTVRTPAAVCAVRGTEADIEQRSLLTVKVYEGHVDLENALGKQSLFAGQISTVAGPRSAPAPARSMTRGEAGNWQEAIDVKDIGKYLKRVGLSDKNLRVKIARDGQEKDVDVGLKPK
jgi:hypothetical protein